ncbi:hypothetical protein [Oribacterium sp. P6A1]|uniref:hypothetical protein n=1 Tax=Oribacterium sp. P6A1 TaxID=1410612 RepID=UPI00055FBC19|nr:hypothetical protein [Oribacterium sp. P6A1]
MEYSYSNDFASLILNFGTCYLIRKGRYEQEESNQSQNENTQSDTNSSTDLNKALALFMFDSLNEITEEKLKRQRNILIKAFHPDNALSDDEYSKKINNAYSILLEAIKAA